MVKRIQLTAIGDLSGQWEDLVNDKNRNKTVATIYTLSNILENPTNEENPITRPGITKAQDGVYDIVIAAPNLTVELIKTSLIELSKITGIEYYL